MDYLSDLPIILPIEGMESEHCSLLITKELKKIPEVQSLKVELNNRQALIGAADRQKVTTEAVKRIRGLGYGVTTEKKSFPVLQMTCASCAVSVESMVTAQIGVVSATVNFAAATLQVEYIPTMTNPGQIRAAVQSIGYDLLIVETDVNATLDALHERNYNKLRKKTYGAILLSLPLVIIGMFFMQIPYANYILWFLSTPIVLWFGRDFFVNAIKQAKHRSANMDTLVALSTGIAYAFSVFNTVYPAFWHAKGLHAHVYFETAAVVITFILLGKMLEEGAKSKTAAAIRKLIGLQSNNVLVVQDENTFVPTPIDTVEAGNVVLVKPGEKIPLDGIIIAGASFIDESALTGEPIPVYRTLNDKVFSGTLNGDSAIQFQVTHANSDTMLSHIIAMVRNAQGSKAPVQRAVDKIAGIFVPVVIIIALLAALLWIFFGDENGLTQGILSLVTVLVIACPCALGLATPTAIMVGVGRGASAGMLIKDAESLERAKAITSVVMDKTGTITEGKPKVTFAKWKRDDEFLKQILYSIEAQSSHPLAHAILDILHTRSALPIEDVTSIGGKGLAARYLTDKWLVGNIELLRTNQVHIAEDWKNLADQQSAFGKTLIWFADQNEVIALFAVSDQVKPTAARAIQQLHDMGISVYMLTGDNENAAHAIANEVGIKEVKSEMLPQSKAVFIKELQSKGEVVAMVGDGINDSAALAQADVSIAMGTGSDIALDVAKITLITSDLVKVPAVITLSVKTVVAIRQNLFWAFVYNVIGIPLAAGVLIPFTGFQINPMIAGAAMALSSVSVVANSLRLKWTGIGL